MEQVFSRIAAITGARSSGGRDIPVDTATIIGATAAFGLVFLAIALGGNILSFLDIKSILIVVGGTVGATLISFPVAELRRLYPILSRTLYYGELDNRARVRRIVHYARKARVEGSLALQSEVYRERDPFLRKALELIVDALPSEQVRAILATEIDCAEERHIRGAQMFQTMGTAAPAMGLIGTLIGLVQMLAQLNDPTQLGPSMATALLTTLYGALISSVVCMPFSAKLRVRSAQERHSKEMTLEGVLGIIEGANPHIIEQKMMSFVAPQDREDPFSFTSSIPT